MRTQRLLLLLPCGALLPGLGCSDSDNTQAPPQEPAAPPVIEMFTVTAPGSTVTHGDWTRLLWRVPGSTLTSILPDVGVVENPEQGAAYVRPHAPVTYVLTASNSQGTVSDSLQVAVRYRGLYVDAAGGDDSRSGQSPALALRTLGEALSRSNSTGSIFLAEGTYVANVTVEPGNPGLFLYGGLNPETFFEEPDVYVTTLRPPSGTPVTISAPAGPVLFSNLFLDATTAQSPAAVIQDAFHDSNEFVGCALVAGPSTEGSALRVEGHSKFRFTRCRIFGPRGTLPLSETRGAAVFGSSEVTLVSCFIDGGRAIELSSGVRVETTGIVRLGLNTISAEVTSAAGRAAAVRILSSRPAIGGNILFTQGIGQRVGVSEEAPGTSPAWLEGNLFISVGPPPYINYDGEDPLSEAQLNSGEFTTGDGVVGENLLVTSHSVREILRDVSSRDYHLVHPLGGGSEANPAVDRGTTILAKPAYGAVSSLGGLLPDIDGDPRPTESGEIDLGADEF